MFFEIILFFHLYFYEYVYVVYVCIDINSYLFCFQSEKISQTKAFQIVCLTSFHTCCVLLSHTYTLGC
jgi:hypothetical protein